MIDCLITIIVSKNVGTQVLFTLSGILCVTGWCQWFHLVYSLIVKEKIFSNSNSNKNTNTRKRRRRIKFVTACIVITLFDAITLTIIFIEYLTTEKLLFDQNQNGFVYNSIKSCHDDLNINLRTLVMTLWSAYVSLASFRTISIVILYYHRLVSILEGSIYQISKTQPNIFEFGFVLFTTCTVTGLLTVGS